MKNPILWIHLCKKWNVGHPYSPISKNQQSVSQLLIYLLPKLNLGKITLSTSAIPVTHEMRDCPVRSYRVDTSFKSVSVSFTCGYCCFASKWPIRWRSGWVSRSIKLVFWTKTMNVVLMGFLLFCHCHKKVSKKRLGNPPHPAFSHLLLEEKESGCSLISACFTNGL